MNKLDKVIVGPRLFCEYCSRGSILSPCCYCQHLQVLWLYRNELRELPAEIGQLTNLQILNIRNNRLRELPAEIRQLTNLQTLKLNGNQFSKKAVDDLREMMPELRVEGLKKQK